jgi:hypothetical protein
MYLERRGYCYSSYDCDNARQNRNIYLAVGICISLCSLLIGTCKYFGKKKDRETQMNPAALRTLAATGTNTQTKREESNEEQLPPYSGSAQGAQVSTNNPQNSSLPLYPVPPQEENNGQSNANQSSPPNSDTPVSSPALNDQAGNLNNTDAVQYPAPVQPRLDQRQENPLNNSSITNQDQNVNTHPATENSTNNTTTPQSTQRL